MKKYSIFKHLLMVIITLVLYYFLLPAINPRSPGFYSFLLLLAIIYLALSIPEMIKQGINNLKMKEAIKKLPTPIRIVMIIGVVNILVMIIGSLSGAKIFNAAKYANLIEMKSGDFVEDVAEINMSQIPLVDRDTAATLGSRKLGEMSDLVSQFEVADDYTQINYQDKPVRVTPLVYGDFFKWLNNKSEGIPAYIKVDMATQETSLVRLSEGMKYSTSDLFFRNIHRYLRFCYPTSIFEGLYFEVDEAGTPYWIAPTVKYQIGLWSGRDIGGAVLVNAVTGDHQYYPVEEVPSWVDRVYNSEMVIEQLDLNGRYSGGFLNATFGQKNVLQTTEGYNYLAIDDDVYLYTGITSVVSDESNIGFVLVNLRTKETRFYAIPGAEEFSAMSSAEGQVQHLSYVATFPILLNVADRPTYFVSLKDSAGLVKMYAFVDVQQYQIVGTGETVAYARADYLNKLGISENVTVETGDFFNKEGTISAVSSAVVGGNTRYYFMIAGDDSVYVADVSINDYLPFMAIGDEASFTGNILDNVRLINAITIGKSLKTDPAIPQE